MGLNNEQSTWVKQTGHAAVSDGQSVTVRLRREEGTHHVEMAGLG